MRILLLLLIAFGVAGCGSDDATTAPRVPGPSDGNIAFEWTGGIAGRSDRIDIRPDGAARVTKRNTSSRFQLTPAELAQLRTLIGDADLKNVPPIKEPQGVADGFLFSVIYDGRTITWGDGGEAPPAEVAKLGAFLSNLIESH